MSELEIAIPWGGIPEDIGYGRAVCTGCQSVVARYCMGDLCGHLRPDGTACTWYGQRAITAADLWVLIDQMRDQDKALREAVREAIR